MGLVHRYPSFFNRTLAWILARKTLVWTMFCVLSAEVGRETATRGHDPIHRIGSGHPKSASRQKSVPEKWSVARIRTLSARVPTKFRPIRR